MRRLVLFILMLLCPLARGQQYTTGFEAPTYNASPSGIMLTNQDGWFNPVGPPHYTVHPYLPNIYNFPTNPAGAGQFTAGASAGGTANPRAQHTVNFPSNDAWTTAWDMAVKFQGTPPAASIIGSFSLQDSTIARSFTALATWVNPNAPALWNMGFLVYNAAGVPVPQPGFFPGPQWQNLQPNHWYRLSTTFSFSQNKILEVAITDLNTLVTTRAQPTGWFLQGGASPSQPIPSAIRLFTGGTVAGSVVGWDNVSAVPFQVTGFSPPQGQEGTIVQITGNGFGTVPGNLSVYIEQGSINGVPMTVLSATDTQIIARLGPVPSGAGSGRIVVTRGTGNAKLILPTLDDVIPEDPTGTVVWDRLGDPRQSLSAGFFLPLFSPPPPGVRYFLGQNDPGMVRVTVNGDLLPNSTLHLITKLHNAGMLVGSDIEATSIRLRVGGDARYLADRVCDVIQSAFSAHGINTNCVVVNAGVNTWQVAVTLLDNLSQVVPIQAGILDVRVQDPILINPFPIGPVTAFYNAGLQNVTGTALVEPVDATGNDGATISPTVPVVGGLRVNTDLIALSVTGTSFTTRAWGVLAGQANQLLGTQRLQRNASFFDVFADFNPIGTPQVQVDVYYNTVLKASALVTAGNVGQVAAGAGGLPQVAGCGGRPTMGPNAAHLWINLDRPCLITPAGGSPVTGNLIRVTAGPGAGNAQNFQAFDLAAGLVTPLDLNSFVIFNAVEGGICYANCDGSATPPVLNVNDFACFLNLFAGGNLAANCDGSTSTPQLNVNDFACFLNTFAAGCP